MRFLGVQSRKIERSSRAEERGAGGGRTSPWGSREAGRGAARQVRRGAHQQWWPGEEGAHGSSRGGGGPADGGGARRPARREKMAGDAENGSTASSTSFAHDESAGDVPWPANRSFPRRRFLSRAAAGLHAGSPARQNARASRPGAASSANTRAHSLDAASPPRPRGRPPPSA